MARSGRQAPEVAARGLRGCRGHASRHDAGGSRGASEGHDAVPSAPGWAERRAEGHSSSNGGLGVMDGPDDVLTRGVPSLSCGRIERTRSVGQMWARASTRYARRTALAARVPEAAGPLPPVLRIRYWFGDRRSGRGLGGSNHGPSGVLQCPGQLPQSLKARVDQPWTLQPHVLVTREAAISREADSALSTAASRSGSSGSSTGECSAAERMASTTCTWTRARSRPVIPERRGRRVLTASSTRTLSVVKTG
ncbi:MAG: hypothetical protein BWY99_01807 [Synergistetes bacterium ADurb.BinA166]|nr:MAG: hypothetical protein BWY99_01807 [Synergistetes bacterium ADurb.BinA166]